MVRYIMQRKKECQICKEKALLNSNKICFVCSLNVVTKENKYTIKKINQ